MVLFCALVVAGHNRSSYLLADSDTAVLLHAIEQRQNPWSWFGGDWPLGNHFYRPISTLVFEFDHVFHGANAAGFGLTNAVLVALMVVALFWFLREFTDSPVYATLGALLFGFWTLDWGHRLAWMGWLLAAIGACCALLPGRGIKRPLVAALLGAYATVELVGVSLLKNRIVDWLPGRTATTMAVFCLIALAAYCRYERLSAPMLPALPPGPLDPPATKNTVLRPKTPRHAWAWAVLSLGALALALGSYEQAVMLPSVLVLAALGMRFQRYQVRWGWIGAAFAILLGYLALRSQLVPTQVSGYQAQQFRDGPGLWIDLGSYAMPGLVWIWLTLPGFHLLMLVLGSIWVGIAQSAGNAVAWCQLRLRPPFALFGLAASFVAFLPMAWLKSFDHYDAWPMALRAILAVSLVGMAAQAVASAASRPTLQAPSRLDPAPGSLPHR